MNLKEIIELPDFLKTEELKYHFSMVLDEAENNKCEVDEFAHALYELADRQWHTYELLDNDTGIRIERWIKRTWNVESEEYMKYIISIVAYLGLTRSFMQLKKSMQLPMKESLKNKIQQAILELKDNIDDPFSGM
jgi:hypothetical protein